MPVATHLNQLLHLFCLISAYNISIHFVSTTTHTRQAHLRLHSSDTLPTLIHFHEFPTPPFTFPPPNPSEPFPSHLIPSFKATFHLRRPIADLIVSLSCTTRRVVVVHDSLLSYIVQVVQSMPNAETYNFSGKLSRLVPLLLSFFLFSMSFVW